LLGFITGVQSGLVTWRMKLAEKSTFGPP
jgi:hypothetical protein